MNKYIKVIRSLAGNSLYIYMSHDHNLLFVVEKKKSKAVTISHSSSSMFLVCATHSIPRNAVKLSGGGVRIEFTPIEWLLLP